MTPLAPERYKLQVTLSRETHEKLRRAQALARHALPDGDVGSILDRALTLLIEHLERRRFARAASPRPSVADSTASGRYIPAPVRRVVWQRDEGRCAFIGRTGRCRETAFLEFHHVAPYAAGGAATADNIQLRCRAHNQYEAQLFFGDTLRERQEMWSTFDRSDGFVARGPHPRTRGHDHAGTLQSSAGLEATLVNLGRHVEAERLSAAAGAQSDGDARRTAPGYHTAQGTHARRSWESDAPPRPSRSCGVS